MTIRENDVISVYDELMIELAVAKDENKYKENVYALYNPIGYGGIVAVGREVVDLIKLFDGEKDVKTIFTDIQMEEDEKQLLKSFLPVLIEKDILKLNGNEIKHDSWAKKLTCWLHITNDCNLDCTYCYIHKTHSNMPDEVLYKSIDMMFESCQKHGYPTLSLMLVGGEPLTRYDVVKNVVKYCSEKKGDINVRYIIPTNGTLITTEVAKFIAENNMSVGISIDGIEKYHDINRVTVGGKGSYKMAIKGINNLMNEGVKPSIMVTVTKQNLDGLPELTKEMIERKMYFRFSFERDTQTGMPEVLKDEEHCIKILNECFEIMKTALKNGKDGWYFKFGDVYFEKPCRRACAAGKNFFSVGQDGQIGSCSLGLEAPKAKLSDITDVIYDIDNIFSDISKTSACDVEECSKCVWRHSCAGACPLQTYATYKTYNHVSPYCNIYKACLPEVVLINAMLTYYHMRKEK